MLYVTAADVEDVVVEEEEEEGGEEEEEEEERRGEEDDNEEEVEARKKGGRLTGSTLEHSRAQVLARKQAINYVSQFLVIERRQGSPTE